MWNFREDQYHRWLRDEKLLKLLPDIEPVDQSFECKIGNCRTKTGIGIHDSSAALIPYLQVFGDPFLLLSTGTWSVAMNPFASEPLTIEELNRDCLNYMNVNGNPVKASRFLLGGEYSHHLKNMDDHFGPNLQKPEAELDLDILKKLVAEASSEKRLILEKGNRSGPFPTNDDQKWDLRRFTSYREALHQCMLDLAAIQVESIKLAIGNSNINQIIITGGFSNNHFFCRLLATMLPEKEFYSAKLEVASALGAALLISGQENSKELLKEKLELTLQNPFENLHIEGYRWSSRLRPA
jgi:L-fuculokinase